MDLDSLEEKLDKALEILDNIGYFAKKQRGITPSCGWGGIPKQRKKKVIFYCKEAWKRVEKLGYLEVCWAGDIELIINTLKDQKLTIEWDKNEKSNIKVII